MMRKPIAVGVAAAWLVTLPAGQSLGRTSLPSTVAVVESESAAEFARQRNVESDASIARVTTRRAAEEFVRQRNAEIDASIARVTARRAAEEFAQQRNAEIDASIARVEAVRQALTAAHAGTW
jgi:hypothetical protein